MSNNCPNDSKNDGIFSEEQLKELENMRKLFQSDWKIVDKERLNRQIAKEGPFPRPWETNWSHSHTNDENTQATDKWQGCDSWTGNKVVNTEFDRIFGQYGSKDTNKDSWNSWDIEDVNTEFENNKNGMSNNNITNQPNHRRKKFKSQMDLDIINRGGSKIRVFPNEAYKGSLERDIEVKSRECFLRICSSLRENINVFSLTELNNALSPDSYMNIYFKIQDQNTYNKENMIKYRKKFNLIKSKIFEKSFDPTNNQANQLQHLAEYINNELNGLHKKIKTLTEEATLMRESRSKNRNHNKNGRKSEERAKSLSRSRSRKNRRNNEDEDDDEDERVSDTVQSFENLFKFSDKCDWANSRNTTITQIKKLESMSIDMGDKDRHNS